MSRRLEFGRRALADLRALAARDRGMADRIGTAITLYAEHERGDVLKLAGAAGMYRLRVGDWRVLFTLGDDGHTMAISRILNRRDAYR
ncbi:MAG: type II toxin-antitoxin system RelE/ParE family toxin [Chloroflexi bacterium]|nr:type II toxin-antitoxin system RelE/ParE family toxin [Chloroflexota bacterium]